MKNSIAAIQQRQWKLLNYVQKKGSVSVASLAEYLGVSAVTVRRDLEELEKKQLLVRRFGLAEAAGSPAAEDEPAYMATIPEHADCKEAIARAAADLLKDGDIVFMNSSATALLVIPHIKKHVTIVTNNGRSLQVKRPEGVDLILTGGEVSGDKQSLTGQVAVEMLQKITAAVCIIGVSGISAGGGLTSRVIQETAVNRTMLSRCTGKKIVTADHTKIGTQHNFYSSDLTDVTDLITDTGADPAEIAAIEAAGISVTLVDPRKIPE